MSPQQSQLACQTECLYPTAQAEGPDGGCVPQRKTYRLHTPANKPRQRSSLKKLKWDTRLEEGEIKHEPHIDNGNPRAKREP